MTIIPAIDILGGECVRLTQGDYAEATVYEKDPVVMARRFQDAGARRIHVVDLDAAHGDPGTNRSRIRDIRAAVDCTIEIGGGIREDQDIQELLDLGVDRLVVGTVLAKQPETVESWIAHYGDIFLAAIDAKDGMVKVSGWEQETKITDVELAARAARAGVSGIIYTSISQDGTLAGPDTERTNSVAEAAGIPVILSGGIGSMDHIQQAQAAAHPGIVGIILGKAIYEGAVTLDQLFADQDAPGSEVVQW